MERRAHILGTGLIGASIGLALRHAGWETVGWDPDPMALQLAESRSAIVRPGGKEPEAGVDLVVLAAPPSEIVETLATLETTALVTDVAGVKGSVVAAAAHLPRFVGGHPMAGGAGGGAALASSRLFHGASWVLTTDGAADADLTSMEDIVRSLGANPLRMTAAEHDAAVAVISHLPHLLAATLMRMASNDERGLALAGGGFRDLTRVAGSETGWWTEILLSNAGEVGEAIRGIETELARLSQALASGDRETLRSILEQARTARAGLGEHHTQVRVVLVDRPGEIARVGHALERSRADVRDFQLRHGEHGGGGILTISVSPATAEVLGLALLEEGFEVET
ncbi:MAG: prephenate dehydrogenase/arogenate dehydrogenase family protein [Actinobacteria bacterium]|nr:prephenate dehydrogenase/arogenate dehydrogenase family protein [Actinomycetota bacterium]MCI0678353.1 prephenate dehydrogenase/arogenate dehydrogenase family protein [Actinomycetota bacterium]